MLGWSGVICSSASPISPRLLHPESVMVDRIFEGGPRICRGDLNELLGKPQVWKLDPPSLVSDISTVISLM
jgi:hypothetical protein